MSSRMSFLKSWLSFWAYKILKGIGDKMKYKGALITGRSKQAQPKYNLLPESRTQSERTAKIDQSNSSGCLSQKNRSEAQRHPWGRCWAEYRRTQKVPVNFSFVCYVKSEPIFGTFLGRGVVTWCLGNKLSSYTPILLLLFSSAGNRSNSEAPWVTGQGKVQSRKTPEKPDQECSGMWHFLFTVTPFQQVTFCFLSLTHHPFICKLSM